jgi:hypothetical protein
VFWPQEAAFCFGFEVKWDLICFVNKTDLIGAPAIVKKDVKKDEGEEIIAKLKEIEAVAELD